MPSTRLLFAPVLLLTVAGCSGDTPQPAEIPPLEDAPKIALVMKSLANEFFQTMKQGAEEHAEKHPGEFELIINGIRNETDLAAQAALVEEMIAAEVDAIVIAPADSKALIPVLSDAAAAGIKIVNIDNRLDAAAVAEVGLSIPFVGPDNRAAAESVAKVAAETLSPGDEVAILEGNPQSFNGQQRAAGFREAAEQEGLSIVDSQSADWEMDRANTIAAAMLNTHPGLKAIFAANDSMALGVLAAARAAGRDDLLIVGFDAVSAAREAVERGEILATADQHGDRLAVYGIEFALDMLENPIIAGNDRVTPVDVIRQPSSGASSDVDDAP